LDKIFLALYFIRLRLRGLCGGRSNVEWARKLNVDWISKSISNAIINLLRNILVKGEKLYNKEETFKTKY